jgi:signal transduction histidine kinase
VIREAVDGLASEIQSGRADVSVSEDFPPVVAHGVLFGMVLSTLLSNALKFVSKEVRPRIRIGHEPRDGKVRIWIQDNGLGIPAEHRDRIFGVFERLQHSQEIRGNGIGLAIAKAAAERMGGRVGVDSEPRTGSRFWIELSSVPARRENPNTNFVREPDAATGPLQP